MQFNVEGPWFCSLGFWFFEEHYNVCIYIEQNRASKLGGRLKLPSTCYNYYSYLEGSLQLF